MQCPNCGSSNVGKIGNNLFFCRNCYCEIKIKKHTAIINTYDQDGCIKNKIKIFNIHYNC